MDKGQRSKNLKNLRKANVLESLKDLGNDSAQSLTNDFLKETSRSFFEQLIGIREQNYTGEITPGETVEMGDIFSGKSQEVKKVKSQMALERNLNREEKIMNEKKTNELRLQLHALMQEVFSLAQTTQGLGEEVEVASMQVPVNPGIYHVAFFEKLLSFLKSFRNKIENASLWLNASNRRAEKKNFWSTYKKQGSKFLLSPDHYLQRSAG
jgi:hypothetical protein